MDNLYDGNYQRAVHPNSSFHPSLGREEWTYHGQHPGSAPFNASHSADTLTSGIPSFGSRGNLISDRPTQYPPHLEHPFVGPVFPGTPVAEHASPVCRQGPAQAAFRSTGSGAPSGTPVPPGSFHASPLHLGWPPASAPPSLGFPLYDPQPVMSSAPPGRVDIQPQPVVVPNVNPAGHVRPSRAARQNRTSAAPPNAHSPSPKLFPCPICGAGSRRRQERNRHMASHLPCWIACSFDGCTWRGDRSDNFKKHLCDEHQSTGPGGYYQLYDPKPLAEEIVKSSILIEDAERLAIAMVEGMALRLGRWELLEDPWGRKGKKSF